MARPRMKNLAMRPAAACALVLLCALAAVLPAHGVGEDKLIGWKGETFNQGDHSRAVHGERESMEEKERGAWIEVLSWAEPRALVYHNYLTDFETDHLKSIVAAKMRPSMVVDSVTGVSKFDPIRTSNNGYLRRGQDKVVQQIEEKLARFSMIPVENGEDIQVLSYRDGQKYDAHHDVGELNTKSGAALASNGGHRVATALMYLSDVDEGGETVFPLTDWPPDDPRSAGPWSECGNLGIAVRPKKGDVLLFFSVDMKGNIDEYSMHGSCPVIAGEKWTATKWIHQTPFRQGRTVEKKKTFRSDPSGCADKHLYCKWWGASGECDKNPGFMLGEGGACRFSCKNCPSMSGDPKFRPWPVASGRRLQEEGGGVSRMPERPAFWWAGDGAAGAGARGGGRLRGDGGVPRIPHDGIVVHHEVGAASA